MAVATVGSPVSRGSVTGSGSYEVRRGDTLSSIGRQFGLSNQALAQRNNLQAPYALHVGQVLTWGRGFLGGQMVAATTPVVTSTGPKPWPRLRQVRPHHLLLRKRLLLPRQQHTLRRKNKTVSSSSTLSWHWPTKGRIVEGFSVAEQGNKGIDISGQKGNPFTLQSSGKVVYAGSALRGYGKLIILKHNDDYLSAYAHNDELRGEGDTVKAERLSPIWVVTDAPDVRLHFEIRYKGKSINPMGYLPKR